MFQAPAPVVEYISPAPAGSLLVQVVENIAPAPAVIQSPAPVVRHISLVPTVFHTPAPVMEFSSPVPAVFPATDVAARVRAEAHVGGLQSSVPEQSSSAHRGDEQAEVPRVTLWLRKRTEGAARIRVKARRSKPLRSVFQAYCRRLGLQESQVCFYFGELLSPDDTPDQPGLEDDTVIETEEVYEEDEDMDEIYGTRSRFPAGFLPMRMCRWYPAGDCRQGWGVDVRSQCERTAPPCSWSRALTISTSTATFSSVGTEPALACGRTQWIIRVVDPFFVVHLLLALLAMFLLALCSLLSLPGPRCSASWPVRIRRTFASEEGFTGRCLHHASVYSAMLGLQCYMLCASLRSFM